MLFAGQSIIGQVNLSVSGSTSLLIEIIMIFVVNQFVYSYINISVENQEEC